MAKKNKTIEVSVQEVTRGAQQVTEVVVGKRVVGEVLNNNGKFEARTEHEQFRAKSLDDGIELVLRQYNLHN